ncbi:UPF0164 family protein [bacterium]|nr:UPF0164 family protein [bacterium]
MVKLSKRKVNWLILDNMKYRILNTVLLIVIFQAVVFAGDGTRRYANAFLEIPLGARAAGIGNAYAAVANDGTAFFWNPAGVALMHKREVTMMYANQFDGLGQYNFVGYSHQLTSTYAFSIGWIRYNVGDIPETSALEGSYNDHGNPNYDFSQYFHGRFSYADHALFFSFAKMNQIKLNLGWLYSEFPMQIPVGINFKVIQGGTNGISGNNGVITKDVSKSGIGVDIGTMIMFGISDLAESPNLGDFAMGLHIQDVTVTGVRYNAVSSSTRARDIVKPNLKFGMSYLHPLGTLKSNILFSYESNTRYGGDKHFGVEWDYMKTVALRLGRDDKLITYGAGIALWQIRLDYALSNHALGNVHRISAAYKF